MNLFVYGTLKDKEIFKRLTGHDATYKPAILFGYKQMSELIIKKANNEDYVSGFLIEDITDKYLEFLDHYEALNKLYSRKKVQIAIDNAQEVLSWVYTPLDQ